MCGEGREDNEEFDMAQGSAGGNERRERRARKAVSVGPRSAGGGEPGVI